MIVWLTGRPASGKTTLAHRVGELTEKPCVILDSDEVRDALGMHGYTPVDRDAFYRVLGDLALLLERQGIVVLVAATGALRSYRDSLRANAAHFVEVHVDVPVSECEARDPKRLYAMARSGNAPELPGIGASYEPPTSPEITARGGFDDDAARGIATLIADA